MLRSRIARGLACLLTALLLITAMPARSLAASVYKVRVTKSYTYIYKTASTSSTHLKKVTKDTVLVCGAVKGSWAYVKYNGVVGYVRTSDIKKVTSSTGTDNTDNTDNTGDTGNTGTTDNTDNGSGTSAGETDGSGDDANTTTVRSTASLRLYKSASTSSGYYGTIAKNKTFTCLSIDGKWALVQVGKYKGYVLAGYLVTVSTGGGSSTGTSTGSTTVDPSKVKGITCYIKTSMDLYATASTGSSAVCPVQIGDKIIVTQVKGSWCRVVTEQGRVGFLPVSAVSKTKIYVNGSIILSDWFTGDIQSVFKVGTHAVVTDVLTRKTFEVRRRGGLYHADCEPLTKSDTATILGIYGGAVSWNRRAIWVTVGNTTYAASMNFMNHGEQTIHDNNFDGHFCIHFYNSRTHSSNKVDPDHQAAVLTAFRTKP